MHLSDPSEIHSVLESFSTEIVRRYESFLKFFSDARRLKVITYCESPKVLLNLFDEHQLEEMTVLVGDRSDYRDSLSEEDYELARRLEQLRREGRLRIYMRRRKTVHAKMYIIESGGQTNATPRETEETKDEMRSPTAADTGAAGPMKRSTKRSRRAEREETVKVLVGSANFTKNGWGYQENYMTVFRMNRRSPLHEQFEKDFWKQVEDYGAPFMEDLTERLRETNTEEERRQVIQRWLGGARLDKPPVEEITSKATKQMSSQRGSGEEGSDSSRIRLSLRGYDKSQATWFERGLRRSGAAVTGKTAHLSPGSFSRWMATEWGIPPMWTTEDGVYFAPPGYGPSHGAPSGGDGLSGKKETPPQGVGPEKGPERSITKAFPSEKPASKNQGSSSEGGFSESPEFDSVRCLSAKWPPDPDQIDEVLFPFEEYFESADSHFAQTRRPEAVKAQMAEAIFWFMWAPFINRHAALFQASGVEDFGKQLPFLYVWGESNSGKGTLAQHALRLISGGHAIQPLDGSELGIQAVRELRRLSSAFPAVFDDAEVRRIKQASPLRNYWSAWDGERRFPALAFTSNDSRPPRWFQSRAKILQFSVYFEETPEAQMRLSRVTSGWPRLFSWVSWNVARCFQRGEVDPRIGDVLRPVRNAVRDLYHVAGRKPPSYMPLRIPAEIEYDLDRERWLQLYRSGAFNPTRQEDSLHLEFDHERFDSKELYGPVKRLPQRLRARKSGTTIVVPHPEAFWEWLKPGDREGFLSRVKRLADRFRTS